MLHLLHILLAANPFAIPADGIAPKATSTIGGGLSSIISLLFELVGSLSVIFIIVGGLLMVLSSGNPARFKQGREAVIYAAVGVGVSIAGYAIISYIAGALGG